MIHTDIVGNTLVVYGDLETPIEGEVVVEIAPKNLDVKSTQLFLEDRKETRKLYGYTLHEQGLLLEGKYTPKQW